MTSNLTTTDTQVSGEVHERLAALAHHLAAFDTTLAGFEALVLQQLLDGLVRLCEDSGQLRGEAAALAERLTVHPPPPPPAVPRLSTISVSALFLAQLCRALLPAEQLMALSGAELGPHTYTLDTGVYLQGEYSAIHVKPTMASVWAAYTAFWAMGSTIRVLAHSHAPANDLPRATAPSSVDLDTVTAIQAYALGVIVVAGGDGAYVRSFSPNQAFRLSVCGDGYDSLSPPAPGQELVRLSPALLAEARTLAPLGLGCRPPR
jgi:hypothetical protein